MAINNTSGAAPSSTLGTLMGVMNTAKEKWDSSGANDAMNRVAASVPQGTKDYLSATTGELFNRQRLRSVTVCFGIGEERPFYVEKSPALLIARVKHNFTFFYLNYLILTALLFCLTLLISPSAIIGIGLLGALWVYVIQQTQKGTLVIAGKSISQSQATTGLVVFSAFALFFLLRGVFWYALCSSGFLVLVHAGLRDASMHQDGDDHVDMVGEVPGETASFLNDNSGVTTKSTYHRNRNIDLSTLFWVLEPSTEPAESHKMSLEAKFASLTIDDASSVVNTVKSEGVEKSGLAANISVLSAKCASEDEAEALSALATVKALAEGVPEAQVFTKECFGACLENATHKSVSVQKASKEAAFAIVDNVQPFAMKSLLPTIFAELPVEKKWNVREVALECIARFSKNAPRQLGDALPLIVPEVTACMWDTKKQVKVAATNAMKSSLDVIGNRDIEHMTGKILTAITKPKEVPEIMHQMAGVTFVQSVESPALAMVVPLLLRGLREKTTATKRQAAVIIDNMSKLVDNPLDAAPFLPLLLPALETNAESIADPEAREVTQRAVSQLNRLKGLAEKQASVRGDVSKLDGEFKKALKAEDATGGKQAVIEYACVIASCLMDLKFMEDLQWEKNLSAILGSYFKDDVKTAIESVRAEAEKLLEIPDEDDEEDDAEELCNCQFTLAYGTKILLHNTKMKLLRGRRYGLLGANDCGKTTLMRAIANNQVEGFPDVTQVRTVFVEADIQGEQSHLSCVDYVAADEKLQAMGVDKNRIREILGTVGFTPEGKAKPDHAVSTLSGGWRMKLALARAMLQQADILLLDEPTNHLDVINVAWVKTYLNSLSNVTSIIVSHDSGLLNDCCTNIMSFDNLKLRTFKGNLDEYVKVHPAARAYFSLTASKMKFKFPQPGPIEGVKSKGKALMKMAKCTFTYPKNEKPTLYDITVQVSLSSRVACIGENGAGKSTMIKLLVGEIEPQEGDVWKHPNARIAYVAQHAFHHIEQHLSKTPNEYIRWRFANGGEDKESLVKVTMQFTDEELALQKKPFELQIVDEASGKIQKVKKVVAELVGGRKLNKSKEYEYEVKYAGSTTDSGEYLSAKVLKKMGWEKACKAVDLKLAQLAGMYVRPLSTKNVEEHLEGCGLAREFGTHYRMSALSGGQKVKVVLAAAMWMQPHIVILDEPTNYLDRESLGALAGAIEEFDGGVIIISHNNEFVSKLCPETWVMDAGHLETKGDADWMLKQDTKIEDQQQLQEMTDAAGNKVEIKQAKKKLSKKEEKALIKKIKAKIKDGEALDTDEEQLAFEKDLL